MTLFDCCWIGGKMSWLQSVDVPRTNYFEQSLRVRIIASRACATLTSVAYCCRGQHDWWAVTLTSAARARVSDRCRFPFSGCTGRSPSTQKRGSRATPSKSQTTPITRRSVTADHVICHRCLDVRLPRSETNQAWRFQTSSAPVSSCPPEDEQVLQHRPASTCSAGRWHCC